MSVSIIYFFKFIFYSIITLPRDIRAVTKLVKILIKSLYHDKKCYSVSDVFKKWAIQQPNKECLSFNDQIWTFQDVQKKYFFYIKYCHLANDLQIFKARKLWL